MDHLDISQKLEPIVKEAGALLLSYYQKEIKINFKGDIDLVTEVDKKSEELLFNKLSDAFPFYGILAEEGHQKASQNGYRWIIDPLDGTTSFAHGFPLFAVSVALCDHDDRPVLSAVFNPVFNEYFSAIEGRGAYLNEKKISVSKLSMIEKSLLGTGFPYNRRKIMDKILTRLAKVLNTVQDVRRTGSAAIDICYVASGRLDGYFEEGLQAWDTAAAWLILTEAGGKMTTFDGSPFNLFIPQALASNGEIHKELISLVTKSF